MSSTRANLAELWSRFPTVQALLGPPLCAGAENVYIDMGTNMGRHIMMLYHPQRFGYIGEYRNWFGSCGWADRGDKVKVCGNATVVRERLASTCVMSFEPSPMHVPNLEQRFRDYRSEGTVFPAAGAQRLHFFSAAIAAHNSVENFHWTFGRGHDTGASLARSSALQHRHSGPTWQCLTSALAHPQGAPGGVGQLGTRRKRPAQWAPSHCLGCSSEPPPKPPISPAP